MFSGCKLLKGLNLNTFFNTNNVKDMSFMFIGCSDELIKKIIIKYKNIREEVFKVEEQKDV